jgi:hypothetical protein
VQHTRPEHNTVWCSGSERAAEVSECSAVRRRAIDARLVTGQATNRLCSGLMLRRNRPSFSCFLRQTVIHRVHVNVCTHSVPKCLTRSVFQGSSPDRRSFLLIFLVLRREQLVMPELLGCDALELHFSFRVAVLVSIHLV